MRQSTVSPTSNLVVQPKDLESEIRRSEWTFRRESQLTQSRAAGTTLSVPSDWTKPTTMDGSSAFLISRAARTPLCACPPLGLRSPSWQIPINSGTSCFETSINYCKKCNRRYTILTSARGRLDEVLRAFMLASGFHEGLVGKRLHKVADALARWQELNPLRQWREAQPPEGWTRAVLARQLDVSHTAVTLWENGMRLPLVDAVARIEELTGITATKWMEWYHTMPSEARQ